MSHYVTLGTPIIAGIFLLIAGWQKRRFDQADRAMAEQKEAFTRLAADTASAAINAALAADRSLPTSNGFALGTREALARIEAEQVATRADIGGLRADVRHVTSRVDDADRRLDDHLKEC